MGDLFEIIGTKSLDSNAIDFIKTGINFIGRTYENNGIQGKIQMRNFVPNEPFTITATVIGNYKYVKFQTESYYCSQNINKLSPKSIIEIWNEKIAYYLIAGIQKFVSLYDKQQGGYKLDDIKNHKIQLPTKNRKIDFDFMEDFVAELEAESVAKLKAYLLATELNDYVLTKDEQNAIAMFNCDKVIWKAYNVKALFGEATRGKRLKSSDRISGALPFVTAGETDEGISAWICNDVEIFSENTSTIDMFGSAKYRNYKYGADDHVAIVHTEHLPKYSAIFITSALNKVSYAGQFDYSRNFYPKDADELIISLPTKNDTPDYEIMETFISAIQKQIVSDVVLYVERKTRAVSHL